MRTVAKLLVALVPALVLTALVGLTSTGCDDDTTTNMVYDLSTPPLDLAKAHD